MVRALQCRVKPRLQMQSVFTLELRVYSPLSCHREDWLHRLDWRRRWYPLLLGPRLWLLATILDDHGGLLEEHPSLGPGIGRALTVDATHHAVQRLQGHL